MWGRATLPGGNGGGAEIICRPLRFLILLPCDWRREQGKCFAYISTVFLHNLHFISFESFPLSYCIMYTFDYKASSKIFGAVYEIPITIPFPLQYLIIWALKTPIDAVLKAGVSAIVLLYRSSAVQLYVKCHHILILV